MGLDRHQKCRGRLDGKQSGRLAPAPTDQRGGVVSQMDRSSARRQGGRVCPGLSLEIPEWLISTAGFDDEKRTLPCERLIP